MDHPNQPKWHIWSAYALDVRLFRSYQSCKDVLGELWANATKGNYAPLSSSAAASRSALEKSVR